MSALRDPAGAGVLPDAEAALDAAQAAIDTVAKGFLAAGGDADRDQLVAAAIAWSAAEVAAARALVGFARTRDGDGAEARVQRGLAAAFAAEVVNDLRARVLGREQAFFLDDEARARTIASPAVARFIERELDPAQIDALGDLVCRTAGGGADVGLDEEHRIMREAFRDFAEEKVAPLAEKVHREDLLIPEEVIRGLRDLGCFGLSIPQRYGGFQDDEKPDNLGMIVCTEELSRASLGVAGSLITRPEILAKALLKGGTEEQRRAWLPPIASGEKMVAVCVTEPDFGSDVAGLKVRAARAEGGWRLSGVKTWATFAGRAEVLMVLARTDPDMSKKHRGLSVLIAEKPPFTGREFAWAQPDGAHGKGGRIEGRAIGTIGYRGMHSFEVSFEDFFVPDANLVGGEGGLGKGFYLQMEGFAGGRLQTAARACGVMQAAFEAALAYATERTVFGQKVANYQLTRWKLARMAALVQAARQLSYGAARLVDAGGGQVESSLTKLFASRVAEWVTREAMQIHGGMGYAEEYPVSRYFVDARVFSIFEGAEEVLALKVVARSLLDRLR